MLLLDHLHLIWVLTKEKNSIQQSSPLLLWLSMSFIQKRRLGTVKSYFFHFVFLSFHWEKKLGSPKPHTCSVGFLHPYPLTRRYNDFKLLLLLLRLFTKSAMNMCFHFDDWSIHTLKYKHLHISFCERLTFTSNRKRFFVKRQSLKYHKNFILELKMTSRS